MLMQKTNTRIRRQSENEINGEIDEGSEEATTTTTMRPTTEPEVRRLSVANALAGEVTDGVLLCLQRESGRATQGDDGDSGDDDNGGGGSNLLNTLTNVASSLSGVTMG